MKMFTTFGVGQFGGVLANYYLEFEGDVSEIKAEDSVRRFMTEAFKGVWCGLYNEEQFKDQPRDYGLSRLAKLDMNGNILKRGDPDIIEFAASQMAKTIREGHCTHPDCNFPKPHAITTCGHAQR